MVSTWSSSSLLIMQLTTSLSAWHMPTPGALIRDARVEQGGPLGRVDVSNQELDGIEAALSAVLQAGGGDAFCWYLYGLVQLDR